MTRVRKRSSAFSQKPCNWSSPLGDGRLDFKVLHCPIFTTFQEGARIFWAGSPLNPSCAIFHTLHKVIKYSLEQGLEAGFWSCLTWVLQSPGYVLLCLCLCLCFCLCRCCCRCLLFLCHCLSLGVGLGLCLLLLLSLYFHLYNIRLCKIHDLSEKKL